MISYQDVLERSRRTHLDEFKTSPINTPLSKRLTWLLVNLNISANQTTVIFFAFAILSALVFPIGTPTAVLVAGAFYWIHVLLDFSDGDLARYHGSFARNGEYWDHVIHLFTIPLIFGGIVLAEVRRGAPDLAIAAGLVLVVTTAFNRGLTDVVRVAKPSDSAEAPQEQAAPAGGIRLKGIIRAAARAIGESRFVLYYTVAVVLSPDGPWREWVLIGSAAAFMATVAFKAVVGHRRGALPVRGDYIL